MNPVTCGCESGLSCILSSSLVIDTKYLKPTLWEWHIVTVCLFSQQKKYTTHYGGLNQSEGKTITF